VIRSTCSRVIEWRTLDELPDGTQGHSLASSTEKTRHSPGMPLSACEPRSANWIREPATSSGTVLETSTSPGPAWPAIRAAMWTAIPAPAPPTAVQRVSASPEEHQIDRARADDLVGDVDVASLRVAGLGSHAKSVTCETLHVKSEG
jgi:hypothetical protein